MLTSIYKRKGRSGVTLEYEDPMTDRTRQRQFRTRAAAIAFRDPLRSASKDPAPEVASDVSFADYAARWLRATKTAVREGTYRVYESTVRIHLLPAFPGQLRAITRAQVRDLVVALREAGRKKKSIRNVRGALHAILEAGIEEGILATNVARFRSRSKLMRLSTSAGEARAAIKAFDADQARAFIAAADEVAPRHAMLFRTMLATGLRPGEAVALQPGDLDFHGGRIRLERAITRGRVEPCKTTAAGEFHYVDLPTALAAALRAWIADQAEDALAEGRSRPLWLFPATTGGPRPRQRDGHLDETKRLGVAFKRALRRAGLPGHFTPHCLRHTYASQQLARGESPYYVQRQLRHADISMTVSTYGSWLPAGNRAAADRHYDALFGGRMSESRQNSDAEGAPSARRKRHKS